MLVFYLLSVAIGYRWTSSSLEVYNSLIYFAHLLKKPEEVAPAVVDGSFSLVAFSFHIKSRSVVTEGCDN